MSQENYFGKNDFPGLFSTAFAGANLPSSPHPHKNVLAAEKNTFLDFQSSDLENGAGPIRRYQSDPSLLETGGDKLLEEDLPVEEPNFEVTKREIRVKFENPLNEGPTMVPEKKVSSSVRQSRSKSVSHGVMHVEAHQQFLESIARANTSKLASSHPQSLPARGNQRGQIPRSIITSDIDEPSECSDDISSSAEENTTVMLRNIPNKYTSRVLRNSIDMKGFKGLYDFFYLPIDFRNKCNLGYAFINFTKPCQAVQFKKAFDGFQLPAFKSAKVCQVMWARVQSLQSNVDHYRNSPINELSNSDFKPLLFSEGKRIEFPKATLPKIKAVKNPVDEMTSLLLKTSETRVSHSNSLLTPPSGAPSQSSSPTQVFNLFAQAEGCKTGDQVGNTSLPVPQPDRGIFMRENNATTTPITISSASPDAHMATSMVLPKLEDASAALPLTQKHSAIKKNKLFIGGLSVMTGSDALREHFSQYGEILEATVIIDKKTSQSRGFGFCTFAEEIPQAVMTSEHWIDGRSVGVRVYATGGVISASTTSTNASAILHQQQQQQQQIQALNAAIQAQQALALNGGLTAGLGIPHSLPGLSDDAVSFHSQLQLQQLQQQLLASQSGFMFVPQASTTSQQCLAAVQNLLTAHQNQMQYKMMMSQLSGVGRSDGTDFLQNAHLCPRALVQSLPHLQSQTKGGA